jgi:hypothetical protein
VFVRTGYHTQVPEISSKLNGKKIGFHMGIQHAIVVGGLDWCSFAPVTTLRYQKSAIQHAIVKMKNSTLFSILV